jgi:PIN domain nuclease of toxin-antitoxin system
VILLDTHIWIWWVSADPQLSPRHLEALRRNQETGLGVSVFSVWEVAKKVGIGKLVLSRPIDEWIEAALASPGVELVPLTPSIVIESTRLPGSFHRDPADQLIVASSRVLGVPLVTADARMLAYAHVETLAP